MVDILVNADREYNSSASNMNQGDHTYHSMYNIHANIYIVSNSDQMSYLLDSDVLRGHNEYHSASCKRKSVHPRVLVTYTVSSRRVQ